MVQCYKLLLCGAIVFGMAAMTMTMESHKPVLSTDQMIASWMEKWVDNKVQLPDIPNIHGISFLHAVALAGQIAYIRMFLRDRNNKINSESAEHAWKADVNNTVTALEAALSVDTNKQSALPSLLQVNYQNIIHLLRETKPHNREPLTVMPVTRLKIKKPASKKIEMEEKPVTENHEKSVVENSDEQIIKQMLDEIHPQATKEAIARACTYIQQNITLVNTQNSLGETLLHLICTGKNLLCSQDDFLFIAQNTDILLKDQTETRPLERAAISGNSKAVEFLIPIYTDRRGGKTAKTAAFNKFCAEILLDTRSLDKDYVMIVFLFLQDKIKPKQEYYEKIGHIFGNYAEAIIEALNKNDQPAINDAVHAWKRMLSLTESADVIASDDENHAILPTSPDIPFGSVLPLMEKEIQSDKVPNLGEPLHKGDSAAPITIEVVSNPVFDTKDPVEQQSVAWVTKRHLYWGVSLTVGVAAFLWWLYGTAAQELQESTLSTNHTTFLLYKK